MTNKWQSFVSLTWYDGLIEFLFRFVAKTSEPLLAAGLVISAADFLTSGALMRGNAAFSMAWAWTQALAIEASSGVVFVYALQAFRTSDKVKAWLYLVLSILLALTGGAMLLFQLIANTTGMQERALPGGLFYGLAVLRVVVSVSYVYLCRAKHIRFTDLADMSEQPTQQVMQPAPVQPAINPDVLNVLIERLDHLSVTVTQLASTPAPALPEQAETMHQEVNIPEPGLETPEMEEPEHDVYGKQNQDFGNTIEAILKGHNEPLTVRQVAALAGCSTRTAAKWIDRLQVREPGTSSKKGGS
jgi:hypothetical protein